ncbi:MAG: NAD(P)-dependent oxidoreductase [Candidatus Velthaea sp.]|jgi:putative NADH-flavin reductase
MKIALFGASGMIGSRILSEALRRGHEVVAIVRQPQAVNAAAGVRSVAGDATDAVSVALTAVGADVAVNAYSPQTGPQDGLSRNAHALIEGLPRAGVLRVIVVGGAGSLEVAPGKPLVDTPDFPVPYKARAQAQSAQLDVFRSLSNSPLVWTFVSPSPMIAPGERTGTYRVGGDALLVDSAGESKISAEDYAVAILDEIERPAHPNARITVGY